MSTHVLNLMFGIIAFMAVGTSVVVGLYLQDRRRRDVLVRTLSWYPVSLFCMGGLWLGERFFIASFVWVSLRALWELVEISTWRPQRVVVGACVGAILLQYIFMLCGLWVYALLVIPAACVSLLPCVTSLSERERRGRRSARVASWVMLGGWALGMIPILLAVPDMFGEHGGVGMVMFLLTITQLNDLTQYVWGKLFGKHPMAPTISPKKTWEGFIGGMISMTLLGTFLGGYITPFGHAKGALLSMVLCIGGVAGDLFVSGIKRRAGVKDMGTLLPGFGGLLDRADSLIFNAPLFLLVLLLTQLEWSVWT